MANHSCSRCTFLFTRDTGYSNWTVLGTEAHCVYSKNPHLPADIPDTWAYSPVWQGLDGVPSEDNWACTKDSRCELYQERPIEFERVRVDVDGEEWPTEEAAMEAFLQGDVMPLLVLKYRDGEKL